MPFVVGIRRVNVRGTIHWSRGTTDEDAVECLHVLGLPIWPIRIIHTSDHESSINWGGMAAMLLFGGLGYSLDEQFDSTPLRWSWAMIARAMVWPYLFTLCFVGAVPGLIASMVVVASIVTGNNLDPVAIEIIVPCLLVPLVSGALLWLLFHGDWRDRAIRFVLGRHRFGSSDPATWTDDKLFSTNGWLDRFQATTFVEAAQRLLKEEHYSSAMWAARLAVALENREAGESLTDEILNNADVQAKLYEVRKKPECWLEVFGEAEADSGSATEDE